MNNINTEEEAERVGESNDSVQNVRHVKPAVAEHLLVCHFFSVKIAHFFPWI